MSAEHIHERANKAAATVDPMVLANALDHIARAAAKSRSQTRRIRWIEQRALFALEGREYRDVDLDLPKSGGPETAEKLKLKAAYYRRINDQLLDALQACRAQWIHSVNADRCLAAIAKATGEVAA